MRNSIPGSTIFCIPLLLHTALATRGTKSLPDYDAMFSKLGEAREIVFEMYGRSHEGSSVQSASDAIACVGDIAILCDAISGGQGGMAETSVLLRQTADQLSALLDNDFKEPQG